MAIDAFGRLRVSEIFTTFNYYPSPISSVTASNLDQDIWITCSGTTSTVTCSYDNFNYISMDIPSTVGKSYVLRYTKFPMIYQPGKSRLLYLSGVPLITTDTNNYESRIGIFNMDQNDTTGLPSITNSLPTIHEGTYFKADGKNIYWADITQSLTTEVTCTTSVTGNLIPQSLWNIDTFDGTGPSGKTLYGAATDITIQNNILLIIDQEWLGVGRIRCGFVIQGIIYYAHQFIHPSVAIQYTGTPRLRICYYLNSIGTTTSSANMRQMCSTSISEGGYLPLGRYISINTTANGVGIPDSNSSKKKYILLALRIQRSALIGGYCLYPNGTILIHNLILGMVNSASGSKFLAYELQLHSTYNNIGTVTGVSGTTYTKIKNSICEYGIGDGKDDYCTSDGYIISSGGTETSSICNFNITSDDLLMTRLCCAVTLNLIFPDKTENRKKHLMMINKSSLPTKNRSY